MGRAWHIDYKGWRICHDPLGKLACYYLKGDGIWWCYFGDTLDDIKAEITRREHQLEWWECECRAAQNALDELYRDMGISRDRDWEEVDRLG